jgi:branched-chain amino acid transport system permease protein
VQQLLSQIASGVTSGCVYGSLALALVMIHRSTGLLNFAQGEMATFCTYIAWWLIQQGLPYWEAFVVTVGVAFIMGAMVHLLLMKPLTKAPALATTIVFIGLFLVFNSVSGLLFTSSVQVFPSPFEGSPIAIGGYVSSHDFGVIAVVLLLMTLLFLFFRYTMMGLKMRGAAANAVSSRIMGVNVDVMLATGWGIAGAIGAIGGMMVAPSLYLDPNMMTGVLLYAFAAALIGGLDNPWGAILGGILVGVLENLIAALIGTDVKLTLVLALMVAIMIWRPAGLFGAATVKRV